MPLKLNINGQERVFAGLGSPATLAQVVAEMDLKGDRIAVEHNGTIAPRAHWPETEVEAEDRLEIVHFVGGGAGRHCAIALEWGRQPTGKNAKMKVKGTQLAQARQ